MIPTGIGPLRVIDKNNKSTLTNQREMVHGPTPTKLQYRRWLTSSCGEERPPSGCTMSKARPRFIVTELSEVTFTRATIYALYRHC
jgi:hypothetical protein